MTGWFCSPVGPGGMPITLDSLRCTRHRRSKRLRQLRTIPWWVQGTARQAQGSGATIERGLIDSGVVFVRRRRSRRHGHRDRHRAADAPPADLFRRRHGLLAIASRRRRGRHAGQRPPALGIRSLAILDERLDDLHRRAGFALGALSLEIRRQFAVGAQHLVLTQFLILDLLVCSPHGAAPISRFAFVRVRYYYFTGPFCYIVVTRAR